MKKYILILCFLLTASFAYGQQIPDLDAIDAVATGDLYYCVDVSDTSDRAEGTGKKCTTAQLKTAIDTDTDTTYTAGDNLTLTGTDFDVDNPVVADLTGNASTASALAANGSNCNAGEFPLGVDTKGAVESCTDATTEINAVVNGIGGTNLTCAAQNCNVDDAFLVNDANDSTTGVLTSTGFTIGSAAIIEAELETIDGVTAGTAAASKAVVLDASLDIATINSLTATSLVGALTGNSDTATALATARTIAGVSFDGTANIDISLDGLSDVATSTATAGHILQSDGTNFNAQYPTSLLSDSGVMTLGGVGGANNENLTLDFETTANKAIIGTGTGVTNIDITPYIIVGGTSAGQSIIAAGLTVNDDSGGGANDDFIAETNAQALAFQVDASADQININVITVLEHVTSDPCTSGEPEGGIFWNATASEACVCDGTNDVRLKDASTACF